MEQSWTPEQRLQSQWCRKQDYTANSPDLTFCHWSRIGCTDSRDRSTKASGKQKLNPRIFRSLRFYTSGSRGVWRFALAETRSDHQSKSSVWLWEELHHIEERRLEGFNCKKLWACVNTKLLEDSTQCVWTLLLTSTLRKCPSSQTPPYVKAFRSIFHYTRNTGTNGKNSQKLWSLPVGSRGTQMVSGDSPWWHLRFKSVDLSWYYENWYSVYTACCQRGQNIQRHRHTSRRVHQGRLGLQDENPVPQIHWVSGYDRPWQKRPQFTGERWRGQVQLNGISSSFWCRKPLCSWG